MEIISDGVIDETLGCLGFSTSLVLKHYIIVPPSFDTKRSWIKQRVSSDQFCFFSFQLLFLFLSFQEINPQGQGDYRERERSPRPRRLTIRSFSSALSFFILSSSARRASVSSSSSSSSSSLATNITSFQQIIKR
uniref:Uncharacterized protein n=1 Tax=Nelumbo nucifera TaxID=4432 RepID=A0A822XG30_NELNU|nr:TPA_asm: hypothetical protein HUJ06_019248 [Nelumbo nucifera]